MIAEKVFYAALFMAEAITAWLYFNYIYTQTVKNIRVFASYALGYALLFGLAQLDSVILNVGSFFVINAILLAINYSCEVKSAILHAAFLTLLMSIAEILVNLLITVIVDDYTAYTYSMSAFVSLVGFSKLLYFLLTILAARLFKPHKNWNEEPSQIVLLCFMPLVSVVIIVTFIYIGIPGQLTSLTEVLVSVSVVALLLVNIIVLFIYNRIQSMDRENAALQMSRLRDQADAEYYGMLQQQYDGQRILIHDIKKHLSVINSMAEEGNSQRIVGYISELENLPEFKRKARLCNEPILNMVLLRYSEYCAEHDIDFSCDVRSDGVSFMDAISITALFGNLLSNAVEAAEKSSEKMIELSVIKNMEQNNVLVSLINSCDTAPVKDSSGNLTTRKDRSKGHGYGTKSISRVVTKFGGRLEMQYDETAHEFHSIIRFPIQ